MYDKKQIKNIDNMTDEEFGKFFKSAKEYYGCSLRDFGSLCSLSHTTLLEVMNGNRITPKTRSRIKKVLIEMKNEKRIVSTDRKEKELSNLIQKNIELEKKINKAKQKIEQKQIQLAQLEGAI